MAPSKSKHPNCPYCTRNLKRILEMSYGMYTNTHIEKLHRLYGRIQEFKTMKRKFDGVGWYCQRCGFSITNLYFKTRKSQKANLNHDLRKMRSIT